MYTCMYYNICQEERERERVGGRGGEKGGEEERDGGWEEKEKERER